MSPTAGSLRPITISSGANDNNLPATGSRPNSSAATVTREPSAGPFGSLTGVSAAGAAALAMASASLASVSVGVP